MEKQLAEVVDGTEIKEITETQNLCSCENDGASNMVSSENDDTHCITYSKNQDTCAITFDAKKNRKTAVRE